MYPRTVQSRSLSRPPGGSTAGPQTYQPPSVVSRGAFSGLLRVFAISFSLIYFDPRRALH
jgi:hypothetical protein